MYTAKHLKHAKRIALLMDSQFSFFGVKFGLDSVIGLIPGFGDIVTLGFSAYLILVGVQLRLPPTQLLRMLFNVGLDTLVGSVPILGDVVDVFFRSNMKNLKILEQHSDRAFEEGEVVHD